MSKLSNIRTYCVSNRDWPQCMYTLAWVTQLNLPWHTGCLEVLKSSPALRLQRQPRPSEAARFIWKILQLDRMGDTENQKLLPRSTSGAQNHWQINSWSLCHICSRLMSEPFLRECLTIQQCVSSHHCAVCYLISALLPTRMDANEKFDLRKDSDCCAISYKSQLRGTIVPHNLALDFVNAPAASTYVNETGLLNPTMIRQWIKACENSHGKEHETRPLNRSSGAIDILLIDVADICLIRASSSIAFCGLSYVWGGQHFLQTTSENRSLLELKGSLGQPQYWSHIPQVIRDAMQLVKLIGGRYLWVDALCIEQNNPAQKHNQIMQMHIVYSHAMLTIVSIAGTNANSPLPRINNDTRDPRSMLKTRGNPHRAENRLFAIDRDPLRALQASVYDSRGWTFQERLLSQRCLFLDERQVYFWCHSQLQSEYPCLPLPEPNDLDISLRADGVRVMHKIFADFPPYHTTSRDDAIAFDQYRYLVEAYRKKKLSHSSDTLNAFSGILAVLAQRNGWTFISGHPEEHFELSLLWMSAEKGQPERNHGFPSWPWAGWNCAITWELSIRGLPDVIGYRRARSELQDLTTFYQTPKRRIASDGQTHHPHSFVQQRHAIPEVASRISSNGHIGLDLLDFVAPVVSYMKFASIQSSTLGYSKIHDSNLNACGIWYGIKLGIPLWKRTNTMVLEEAGDGLFGAHVQGNDTQEVVALSRFQQFEKFWTLDHPPGLYEEIFESKLYPFSVWALINVMLIQWSGDQAERVDIGLMHERAFDDAGPVKKSIILA